MINTLHGQRGTKPLFDQVTIVGLGLIGGSIGLAIKKSRVARRVIGFSRHEETIRRAKTRGAINDGDTEFCPNWLGESDLVIIATPPLTVVPIAREVARMTTHRFVMTDVASTKAQIVQQLERSLPSRISFVGSHPMAGSEKSGIQAARNDLFSGTACIVTPTPRSSPRAVRSVADLWKSVGGHVVRLSPARHDNLVAEISHVPHLVAVTLANTASKEAMVLSAGGFADTTRVALSDPKLWSEIIKMNQKEVRRELDQFIRKLEKMKAKIGHSLLTELRSAQRIRQKISK